MPRRRTRSCRRRRPARAVSAWHSPCACPQSVGPPIGKLMPLTNSRFARVRRELARRLVRCAASDALRERAGRAREELAARPRRWRRTMNRLKTGVAVLRPRRALRQALEKRQADRDAAGAAQERAAIDGDAARSDRVLDHGAPPTSRPERGVLRRARRITCLTEPPAPCSRPSAPRASAGPSSTMSRCSAKLAIFFE